MRPAHTAQDVAATSRTRGMHAGIAAADHAQLSPPLEAARWPRRLIRWALWGVGALLGLGFVLAAIGLTYQAIATEQDRTAYPPPGQLVDVGGHRLHLQCLGTGSPIVVTESGLGGTSLDWSLVQPFVAQTTRMCTYDRAGFGWSDSGPSPRSSGRIVEELHALLASAGIPGPYVLVGHSVGGLHAQLFASRYADEVSGLVLLDPTPTAYLASLDAAAQREAAPPMEQLRMLQLMQHVGLARLLGLRPPMPLQTLSPEVQQQINANSLKSTVGDALYEEASAYQLDFAESLNATPLRADIPLLVLLRGQVEGPPDQDAAGKAANADLARRSTQGQVVVAEGSRHFIQLDRPDLVIDAIHQIVESVRTER